MNFNFRTQARFALMGSISLAIISVVALTSNAQDLSDDISSPDLITIGVGSTVATVQNSVFESDLSNGIAGNTFGDIDFFNIEVEDGFQLDSIVLDSFSGDGLAFFGFAEDVLGGNPAIGAEQPPFIATALGFTLIDGSETSLFTDLAAGEGGTLPGIGFDPSQSLDAGTYAFVFQNTGPDVNTFSLTFTGSAVPEPASAALISILGLAGFARRRR